MAHTMIAAITSWSKWSVATDHTEHAWPPPATTSRSSTARSAGSGSSARVRWRQAAARSDPFPADAREPSWWTAPGFTAGWGDRVRPTW